MDQLSYTDLFKKSFLAMAGTAGSITPVDIIINILVSFALGMFIFFIYKKTFQGVLYQRSFNISLVLMSTITSLVIMTISGNLVLSLGMVGALSIVRFRTPIKDSIDLVYIFWAISVGLANGVGYYNISLIGSILIGIILLALTKSEERDHPYLLVLHIPLDVNEDEVYDLVKDSVRKYKLKAKTINDSHKELTAEVKLHNDNHEFISNLKSDKKIVKGTLIAYSGDMSNT